MCIINTFSHSAVNLESSSVLRDICSNFTESILGKDPVLVKNFCLVVECQQEASCSLIIFNFLHVKSKTHFYSFSPRCRPAERPVSISNITEVSRYHLLKCTSSPSPTYANCRTVTTLLLLVA